MIGKQWLSAILAENSIAAFLAGGDLTHLFKADEVEGYQFLREHVKKYGALPKPETVVMHLGHDALLTHKEPSSYYQDYMEKRFIEHSVKKTMLAMDKLLKPESKDPEGALALMAETVMSLAVKQAHQHIADFRQAYEIIVPTYVAKLKNEQPLGITYGWPTLDKMTGGVTRGDLVSFVGRPAKGKTWQMLFTALSGWQQVAGKMASEAEAAAGGDMAYIAPQIGTRMFVSMEMPIDQVMHRLAAMHSHVSASQLKHTDLTSAGLKKLKAGLTEIKMFGAPFWVIDGNLTATIEDIWLLARQLNPDGLWIDGGYLVKHPTEKDRFRRVAENADLMKSHLAAEWPTTVSWQFAKSASKKKKGEQVTGDDVGYSDAIFQVSSVLMGLFEQETVETLHQRCVEILKGRSGETGSFVTNWNFDTMDFSEVQETSVEDLAFV